MPTDLPLGSGTHSVVRGGDGGGVGVGMGMEVEGEGEGASHRAGTHPTFPRTASTSRAFSHL